MSDAQVKAQSAEEIPQWAKVKACELSNGSSDPSFHYTPEMCGTVGSRAFTALCEHVAAYEKAPVDPDLLLARKSAASLKTCQSSKDRILSGDWDYMASVKHAYAAIKLYKETHKQCSC